MSNFAAEIFTKLSIILTSSCTEISDCVEFELSFCFGRNVIFRVEIDVCFPTKRTIYDYMTKRVSNSYCLVAWYTTPFCP